MWAQAAAETRLADVLGVTPQTEDRGLLLVPQLATSA